MELAPDVEEMEDKKEALATSILTQLKRLNTEFANYVPLKIKPLKSLWIFPKVVGCVSATRTHQQSTVNRLYIYRNFTIDLPKLYKTPVILLRNHRIQY